MNCLVTTSWDDNSIFNKRLGSILNEFGILGTFYVSGIDDFGNSLEDNRIKRIVLELNRNGHEIGAHSMNHPDLTKCHNAMKEICESKSELEDFLGGDVLSFAYPYGSYDTLVKEYVEKSGFKYARSAHKWSISYPKDIYEAEVSVFASRHLRLRERMEFLSKFFPKSISKFMRWIDMARLLFDLAYEHSGVFHMYGHPWELETQQEWDTLIAFFRYMRRRKGVTYVTNGELLEFL